MRSMRPKAEGLAIAAFLSAAYLVSMWASFVLSAPGKIPVFWPCNGFLAAAIVLLDRRLRLACIAICMVGGIIVFFNAKPVFVFALSRGVLTALEATAAGHLACWALGPRRLLRTGVGFLRLQFQAVVPAAVAGWGLWALIAKAFFSTTIHQWGSAFVPHVMGMAIVIPGMLLLFQPSLLPSRRPYWEMGLILGGLAAISALLMEQSTLPVAFLIMPMLMFTAFRLGPRGSALAALLLCAVTLRSTVSGQGPFLIHPEWTLTERALIYQVLCLLAFSAVSLCAFILAEQARLRRLLLLRATAARAARRRALEASRAKTEFLATMSHEIRTPMNSILGFTQVLLQQDRLPAEARDTVEVIAQAGESLMIVLNDILDLSKVEAGQVELHLAPTDVSAIAASALEMVQAPAQAKGLTLRLEIDGAEGAFATDGQRLKQILLNLLNNAVKFTGEGHVLLRVVLAQEVLRFEVCDTGIGMTAEVIDRLFNRFSQADSAITRDYGGTGLGLAICKGLAEQMGGRIGVSSRPSVGSTFWLELTAHRAAAPPAAPPQAQPWPQTALRGRILLVDDHPMNRHLGATLLGALGCEVDVAASGEEAIDAAARNAYDAILMDVHMPRMDGLAATRAIRALDGASARTPIIAMSADVMARSLEQCLGAGMVDHIAKPIALPVMRAVLERWLNAQTRRSAA